MCCIYVRSVQVCHCSADAGSCRLCAIRAGTCTAPGAAQTRKGRENAITTNKNTKKKTACAFYRTDSAWTNLVAGVSVPREGEIAIAPEIGLKIPADARAVNNITRVYLYKRYIMLTINIYIPGGYQNV